METFLRVWPKVSGVTLEGSPPRLVRYLASHAHFMCVPLIPWSPWYSGTVLMTAFLWVQLALWLLYTCLVGYLNSGAADVLRKGPAVLELQGVVTFLVGLYVSLVVARWWRCRECYQELHSGASHLTLLVATFVAHPEPSVTPAPTGKEDPAIVRQFQENMVRYALVAHELAVEQAGQRLNLEALVKRELLTREEKRLLWKAPSAVLVVLSWLARHLHYLADGGLVRCPAVVLPQMHKDLAQMRAAAEKIFMHINTQIPFCYVQLLGFAVHLTLFLKMSNLAKIIHDSSLMHGSDLSSRLFWALLMILSWTLFYDGLLLMQYFFENPFGLSPCHFPLEQWSDRLSAAMAALLMQPDSPSDA
eukprot:RCo032468